MKFFCRRLFFSAFIIIYANAQVESFSKITLAFFAYLLYNSLCNAKNDAENAPYPGNEALKLEKERIIDAHAHIFPQKIAAKAVDSIGHFYDLTMHDGNGTAEALLESGRRIGVDRYLVCSTATRPGQVKAINDFIWEESIAHPEFVPFATMHPDLEDLEEEMERILSRGYYGLKLHPDFQEFNIDDDRAMEIYRLAEGKLAILFHTGDNRYDFSAPRRMERVAERFPNLTCIAAHFGGYRCWEEALSCYEAPNIYMDTSSALFALPAEGAWKFFERFGFERFFFGTDFPMWTHEDEMARFNALGLPPKERAMILSGNFARVILKETD